MKFLKITSTDYGLWVAETSAGVRWSSSSLAGLLDKIIGENLDGLYVTEAEILLASAFSRIKDTGTSGNIVEGLAGA